VGEGARVRVSKIYRPHPALRATLSQGERVKRLGIIEADSISALWWTKPAPFARNRPKQKKFYGRFFGIGSF
jgi:hypothetical protein